MHNHNGKGDNWMMWVMMLCCVLPLLLIVAFGAGGNALGAPTWFIVGGIAVMVIVHFFMMGKSHKYSNSGEDQTVTNRIDKDKKNPNKNHSDHDCCH